MVQFKVWVGTAVVLVVVSVLVLVAFSHFSPDIVMSGNILAEALSIAFLATLALFFTVLRSDVVARKNADRKVAELSEALESEIVAHRATEEELRARADEIEYNHSFIETHAADMVALAEQISAQKSDIEESKRRSDYTANHDLLTGLPNRRHFQKKLAETVAQAADQGREAALIYIDLNNFKAVNDQLGHDRGDKLLQDVAERLRASLPSGQVAARLGGDEFGVIVSAPEDLTAAIPELANALGRKLKIEVEMPEGVIAVGASLGFAVYPQDGVSASDILRRADQAMYAAKAEKGACVVAYNDIAGARHEATRS